MALVLWVLAATPGLAGPQTAGPPVVMAAAASPRAPQPDALSGLLDSLLESGPLAGDHVGMILLDRSGKVRFSRNADRRFVPASVRKLLVTAAALSLLGPGEAFATRVLAAGRHEGGRLDGDLYVVGGGDPGLDDDGLADLAGQVASAGIRAVSGGLVADASAFRPAEDYGLGWPLDDEGFAYATRVSALVVNRNSSASRLVASLRPAEFALARFGSALASAGVAVEGPPTSGTAPAGAIPVAERRSAPVRDLVAEANKRSDNLFAEVLLRHLAARATPDATASSAALGLEAELDWLGWPRESYRLVDGSGLSRYDLLTPRQVAEVLWRMRGDPDFVASLPVAGLDGTMAERLAGTPAQGRVRAKTGSMGGVSSLAGYAGDRWIFAFMVNGHVGTLAPVRAIQDALCLALTSSATPSAPVP